MKICAVIPAAGFGTRLGLRTPKILAQLSATETVLSILRARLLPLVDHINIIASPSGAALIEDAVSEDAGKISVSLQEQPIGMGDAIFCGYPIWSQAQVIVVIWGDQIFISKDTLARAIAAHAGDSKCVALPLTQVHQPYVEYVFEQDKLLKIHQSREGDLCAPTGKSDVGTFVLSVADLKNTWEAYLKTAKFGSQTQEINFLPFLTYLAAQHWTIRPVNVKDNREARGINTRDDLLFFQNLLTGMGV